MAKARRRGKGVVIVVGEQSSPHLLLEEDIKTSRLEEEGVREKGEAGKNTKEEERDGGCVCVCPSTNH